MSSSSPGWMMGWGCLLLGGCYIDSEDRRRAKDRDLDGFFAQEAGGMDCDDNNPTIHPGQFESCLDDVDADCDGYLCAPRVDYDLDAEVPLFDLEDAELDQFGASLMDAMLDGDGVSDLVISAPAAATDRGAVLFLGGPLVAGRTLAVLGDLPLVLGEVGMVDLRAEAVVDADGDGDQEVVLTAKVPRDQTGDLVNPTHDLYHYVVDVLPEALVEVDAVAYRISGGIWGERESRTPHRAAQGVGDQDGDGRTDWMLRGPLSGEGETGEVYLLQGLPEGDFTASEAAWLTLEGAVAGDRLGRLGRGAPDLDGDGVAEVVVGAPGADLTESILFGTVEDVGAVYVFSLLGAEPGGGGVRSAADADLVILGAYTEAPIEEAFGLGDTNGDGREELGVFLQTGAGELALFRDLATVSGQLQATEGEVRLFGSLASEFTSSFGRDVISADVDRDGLSDLMVMAPLEPTLDNAGEVTIGVGAHYLFLGPVSGVQSPDHARARWKAGDGDLTPTTPVVVDADGEGTLDLLLGFSGNGAQASGRVYWLPDPFSSL